MLSPEHQCIPNTNRDQIPIPFALSPAHLATTSRNSIPVEYHGRTFTHLDPGLAAQAAALPPLPKPRQRCHTHQV